MIASFDVVWLDVCRFVSSHSTQLAPHEYTPYFVTCFVTVALQGKTPRIRDLGRAQGFNSPVLFD